MSQSMAATFIAMLAAAFLASAVFASPERGAEAGDFAPTSPRSPAAYDIR